MAVAEVTLVIVLVVVTVLVDVLQKMSQDTWFGEEEHYTGHGVTVLSKNEEQSFVAEEGLGSAFGARTARRQLSRLQSGVLHDGVVPAVTTASSKELNSKESMRCMPR